MNKQTEALKMAIEALERVDRWLQERHMGNLTPLEKDALQACKEALELSEKQHTISDNDQPAPSWQGLSDDEMMKIIEACEDKCGRHLIGGFMIARAIEQALKEKNT